MRKGAHRSGCVQVIIVLVIPDEIRRRDIELVAVARFHVAADRSTTVDLIQATPEPRLNSALLDALARWRFFPAIENGHPVASIIDIRIPISVHSSATFGE